MSRIVAIMLALLLCGLVVVEGLTVQDTIQGGIDIQMLIINIGSQLLLVVGLVLYCGFAALHSVQHIDSPQERSYWLVATIALNVLGSCWYYLTAYQSFRLAGKGKLMPLRKAKDASKPPEIK